MESNYGPATLSQCSETAFGSHPCRVVSVSYKQMGCCHGTTRGYAREREGIGGNRKELEDPYYAGA